MLNQRIAAPDAVATEEDLQTIAKQAYGELLAELCAEQRATPGEAVFHSASNIAFADYYQRLADHGGHLSLLPDEEHRLALQRWDEQRIDADAHDDHVADEQLPALQPDAGDAPILALEPLDPHTQPDIHAVRTVFLLIEARKVFSGDAREDARQRLEQRHSAAKLCEHCYSLETDIAAADHHDAPRAVIELSLDAIDIRSVANRMDSGTICARKRQPARVAASSPDEVTITDRFTACERYRPRLRVVVRT